MKPFTLVERLVYSFELLAGMGFDWVHGETLRRKGDFHEYDFSSRSDLHGGGTYCFIAFGAFCVGAYGGVAGRHSASRFG
jgi:hypothetical protein